MSEPRLSWDLFAAFLAVCRTGSLSGAARALGLSQPTVRRQIETLEAAAGAPLFMRQASGLVPVDGSSALLGEAKGMEAAAEAFLRLASGSARSMAGVVRVTCSAVFSVEILPPILSELRAAWPELTLELSASDDVENILRRDADVAVRLQPPDQDAIVARKVAPITFGFYCAPGPIAAAVAGMDWEALSRSGLLIVQDRKRTLDEALTRLGLPLPVSAALRCDDGLAQLAAIRAGLGVGITQLSIARRYGLVPVCPGLKVKQDVWVAMHEDQRGVLRVRTVFDALARSLKQGPAARATTD
jgi:DNA-binding transcriptional LysR family regulator